jgi:hypothetical protein
MTPCTCCRHRQRVQLDADLIAAHDTFRVIAKRYGRSLSSIHRHKKRHLDGLLKAAREREEKRQKHQATEIVNRELLTPGRLLEEVDLVLNASRQALVNAIKAGDSRAQCAAVSLIQKNVAMLGMLAGISGGQHGEVRLNVVYGSKTDGAALQNEYNRAVKTALGLLPEDGEESAKTATWDTTERDGNSVPAGVEEEIAGFPIHRETQVIDAQVVPNALTTPPVPKRPALPAREQEPNIRVASNASFFSRLKEPL